MGGFRINGCGVTDHFKKLKSLGVHMCPACNREAEFFLEEAKQKIDVLFIPTLTLKSRYAVMCSRCEQGKFCPDDLAYKLLADAVPPSAALSDGDAGQTQTGGAQAAAPAQQAAAPAQQALPERTAPQPPAVQPPAIQPPPTPARAKNGVPTFFKCAFCGVTQMREGDFCSYCGKPAPAPEADPTPGPARAPEPEHEPAPKPAAAADAAPVCPACGARQAPGGRFCSECGAPMRKAPEKAVCPACGAPVNAGAAFCMECGAKL